MPPDPLSVTRTRASIALSARAAALLVLALVPVGGCSSHDSATKGSVAAAKISDLPACREYLEAYTACMRRLAPQTPDLASARTAALASALDRTADTEAALKTCSGGLTQLKKSCP